MSEITDSAPQCEDIGERKIMMDNPLVSIITPVLNGMKYLETCIQSVLGQSYPHIEHIFVDAVSHDGTLERLQRYGADYPGRIRIISEPDNGVGEALNKGFAMARGEIFGWLDSDGRYQPDTVEMVVNFYRGHPEAYFVFGDANHIDEAGDIIGKHPTRDFNLKEAINDRCYIPFQSAFHRREVIQRVGGFNPLGNSHDFWIRVGKVYQLHRIDRVLSNNRLVKDSIFFSRDPRQKRVLRDRLLEDYNLCRGNGGSMLAPRCRRYFIHKMLDRIGLYLLLAYPFEKLRQRNRFVYKLSRIAGF